MVIMHYNVQQIKKYIFFHDTAGRVSHMQSGVEIRKKIIKKNLVRYSLLHNNAVF